MGKGKYHEWLEEDGLVKLQGYARDGLVDEQIAYNMGIATSTLYEYKKRFPEIAEALKEGKEVVDRKVENALLKRATGYEYEEIETWYEDTANGQKRKVKKVKKEMPPDTTAAIFWLKNRKPEEWRDRHQQEHSGGLDVTHQYKDLPPEELKELAKKYEDILADE